MILTLSEAIKKYGKIENGKWENESKWMTLIEIPNEIGYKWINSANKKPVTKIYCNRDLVTPLLTALTNIKNLNLLDKLNTFDGCFQIRMTRGSINTLSSHAYGLAIDINAKDNQLYKEPKIDLNIVKCFKDCGFTWGGDFTRKDGMHFSRCWE